MATSVLPYSTGRDNMLNACRGQLGKPQYEFPVGSNRTEYGKEYGLDGDYWCVIFLYVMLLRSGNSGAIPKTASTGAVMRWAKSVGRWRTSPEPGYFSIHVDSRGRTAHIEVVEQGVYQIGGNTSKGTTGSLANGLWVARNNRSNLRKNGRIIGYVSPLYGLTIEAIKRTQGHLGLTVDGKYGPDTRRGVTTFQQNNGLTADGFPGPDFFAKIDGGASPTIPPSPSPVINSVPAFPLPSGMAYGPASGPITWVSGRGVNTRVPNDVVRVNGQWKSKGLQAAQQHLRDRGWHISADGRYGDETENVVKQFQKNKGLTVDGLIGPDTWHAIFSLPVT